MSWRARQLQKTDQKKSTEKQNEQRKSLEKQTDPRRSTERSTDAWPKKRFASQEEADSSAHRLSKVPDRFGMFRSLEVENQETFCGSFFKSNPGALDMRSPEEKLKELEEKLKTDDQTTRFKTLMQISSMHHMLYGEDSIESLRSHIALGKHYNDVHKPPSAIRHLEQAKQLTKTHQIEENDVIEIIIELAYAYASSKGETRMQTLKYANTASSLIKPYKIEDISDPRHKLQMQLIHARIAHAKRKYQRAVELFNTVMDTLQNGSDQTELAQVCLERGECYEGLNNYKQAKEDYQRAHDLFVKLDAVAVVAHLQAKLAQEEKNPPEQKESDKL